MPHLTIAVRCAQNSQKQTSIRLWELWILICALPVQQCGTQNSRDYPLSLGFETVIITDAGCIAAGMGRAFSRVRMFLCMFVCLFVRALKGKRLERSAPNLVHICYSSRSACIDPVVRRSRSHSYEKRHGGTLAGNVYSYGRALLLPAWVCTSIRLPTFSSCSDVVFRGDRSIATRSTMRKYRRK